MMFRKKLWRFAAGIGILVLPILSYGQEPSGPSGRNADEPRSQISIEIGLLSTGGEGLQQLRGVGFGAEALRGSEWILGEIKSFMAAHPDVTVETLGLAGPRRLEEALASSAILPQNVIGLDSWFSEEVVFLADQELIVPIDDFMESDPDIYPELFDDNLWDTVTYRGKKWGVPWVTDPVVLVCNWPLFEAAGIEAPPTTWDEFMQYARRMTKDTDGDGSTDQWGYGTPLPGIDALLFFSMILQKGHPLFTKDGLDIRHSSVKETAEFLRGLYESGVHTRDTTGSKLENCAMEIFMPSYFNRVPNSSRYILAPLPTFGRKVASSYGRLYLAIRKSTPEKERASWELVKWISRENAALPSVWGGYPARKDFVERDDFKLRSQTGVRNLEVLYSMNAWTMDPGPHFKNRSEVLRTIWFLFNGAIRGGTPVE